MALAAVVSFASFSGTVSGQAITGECSPTALPATFAFTQPQQLVDYLNSLPTSLMPAKTTGIDGANPRADSATMAAICNFKGYTSVVDNYSTTAESCDDNTLVAWNGSQFTWTRNNSCALGGQHLHRLTCGSPKPTCAGATPAPPSTPGGAVECSDGIDNDGDGAVDALANGGNPNAATNIGGGNPFAVRALVNSFGFGIPSNGALHIDTATANKVCQLAGYVAASSSDCHAPPYENRCGWKSFGDNTMYTWNGSSFVQIRDNNWLSSVNCIGQPAACADGKDNDGDGKIDTADDGCASTSDASEAKHDPQCLSSTTAREGPVTQCNDRVDNDGDGKVDVEGGDPGCADAADNDETDPPLPPCPAAYPVCGAVGEGLRGIDTVTCPEGQRASFSPTPFACEANGERGTCYACADIPDDGDGGDGDGDGNANAGAAGAGGANGGDPPAPPNNDPPPICPAGCTVDADCGTDTQCSKVQNADGTKTDQDLCWKEDGMCVKKCKVPRCINNACTMAAPAEGTPGYPYVQCEGVTTCPEPRCGDGVVQAGDAPPADVGEDSGQPGSGSATAGGAGGTGATCNVTGTSCAQVSDARACKEPYCVDVNGREIQGTSCTCPAPGTPPPVDCRGGYYLPSGQYTPTRPSGCVSLVSRNDGTCNCIMASLPGASPSATVASLINGSSLLATSIVNNCSVSCLPAFVERNCGAGDACFAFVGARSVVQRCAPASCAQDPASCGMQDYGGSQWQQCPGTAQEPDGPDQPGDPVGEPTPADGEECDDGNNVSNDGCGPSCKVEICGDGALQPKGADGKPNTADDEQCDDGNRELGDGCDNACQVESCGNGVVEYGEECDDGAKNSDSDPGACRMDCMMPKCNDGIVDNVAPWNEQCDCGEEGANFDWEANKDDAMSPYCEVEYDGKPAICHMGMCRVQYCGDGFAFNPGLDRKSGTADDEMCDAGPLNSDSPLGAGACSNNAQCPAGQICANGECGNATCTADADCSGGKCFNGYCARGGCRTDADCSDQKVCKAGACVAAGNGGGCSVNNDCPSGICHPNGSCAPESSQAPADSGCRMDCKAARCGDGVVDAGAGETCDEGAAMFKCNGTPQPSCDCAIPSYGSHTPGVGPFNTTCCPSGQYCSVWATATCPADCGVSDNTTGGRGVCGNHRLELREECDTSVPGWQGQFSDWADAQVNYAYRPNRDGTQAAFASDDGNWKTVAASIEQKYATIDHAPGDGVSEDNAYLITSGAGAARTYFHLWDIPLTTATSFSDVRIRVGVDFQGNGTAWKVLEANVPLRYNPAGGTNNAISAVDMNAAILAIVADEAAHSMRFRLFHSVTGAALSDEFSVTTPAAITGSKKIALDAVEITAYGTSLDESYSCNQCMLIRCGNRIVDPGETCDDGNAAGGDGCSDRCELEICAVPQ